MSKIQVAWSRRSKLSYSETTDEEGYAPYEFSFNDGRTVIAEVKQEGFANASFWQPVKFGPIGYMTRVEVWQTREGDVYIYAEPDKEAQEKLLQWVKI